MIDSRWRSWGENENDSSMILAMTSRQYPSAGWNSHGDPLENGSVYFVADRLRRSCLAPWG